MLLFPTRALQYFKSTVNIIVGIYCTNIYIIKIQICWLKLQRLQKIKKMWRIIKCFSIAASYSSFFSIFILSFVLFICPDWKNKKVSFDILRLWLPGLVSGPGEAEEYTPCLTVLTQHKAQIQSPGLFFWITSALLVYSFTIVIDGNLFYVF